MPKAKAPKRKCKFREEFTENWSFIKSGKTIYQVECDVCKSCFSIAYGGKSDIVQHIATRKHKSRMPELSPDEIGVLKTGQDGKNNGSKANDDRNIKVVEPDEESQLMAAELCSASMVETNSSLIEEFSNGLSYREIKVVAAEATMAFHTIKHNHSLRSAACISKICPIAFSDSSIAKKFSCGRTKAKAIIKNVLTPHTIKQMVKDLSDSQYYGISTDTSNSISEKLFPLVIHYFTAEKGMQVKLLRVCLLPSESADAIAEFCKQSLQTLGMDLKKCVAYSGNTANTNCGGGDLEIRENEVFAKLKSTMNECLQEIEYPAHLLHNTLQTGSDAFTLDVELIVLKLFSYFKMYTVENETLFEFCRFVDAQYHSIFTQSKTRWVSLAGAMDKILKMFLQLKSYFLCEENAPNTLVTFFADPLSEAYLHCILITHNFFNRNILRIEAGGKSVIEVWDILNKTAEWVKDNVESHNILPKNVGVYLNKDEISTCMKLKFTLEIEHFNKILHASLTRWIYPLEQYNVFSWMSLAEVPSWQQIEETCSYLQKKGIEINDSDLFNQWTVLTRMTEYEIQNNSEEWNRKLCHEKWTTIIQQVKFKKEINELLTICQYMFSIPVHNAHVDRTFSLMTDQLSRDRNRLDVSTTESIMQCLVNLDMSCTEFHQYVLEDKYLQMDAKNSKKYA